MKHLASRRRRGVCLILLLLFLFSFYLWSKEGLKSFIEKKLGQLLNSDVTIGSVEGGIAANLVLVNVKFLSPHSPSNTPGFEARRVQLNFRLWDILFNNITFSDILPLIVTKAELSTITPIVTELSLQISPKPNRGDKAARFTEAVCAGNFYLFGNTKMAFAGDIVISNDGLSINKLSIMKTEQEGRIDIEGKIDSSNFLIDLKLDHFKIGDIDLSTNIKIKQEIAENIITGELITVNSIMNFEPVKEIKAGYELSASVFRLITLEWAKGIKISGIVKLTKPADVDLLLEINDLDLPELAFLAGRKEKEQVSGRIDGTFSIKGFLPSPDIKGSIVSKAGHIGNIHYDSAKLNLSGRSPLIKIVNSWIQKEENYTLLEGEIDLNKIGSGGLFSRLEIVAATKMIVWSGLDITRDSNPEIELGRDVGENFRVRFKTFMNNELLNEDVKGDEFSLDYKISEDETLKMRLKESEEFLGIERKLKF